MVKIFVNNFGSVILKDFLKLLDCFISCMMIFPNSIIQETLETEKLAIVVFIPIDCFFFCNFSFIKKSLPVDFEVKTWKKSCTIAFEASTAEHVL